MIKQLLNQDPVRIETEPLAFDVDFLGPLGNKAGHSMRLELDGEGFWLSQKTGAEYSRSSWAELRELGNDVRERGRFSYHGKFNWSAGGGEARIRIRLQGGDAERERLARVFDQLPPDVYGRKCPECFGPVIEKVCKHCVKSYTAQQRKRGLLFLLGGMGVALVGGVLTAASFNPSTGEATVYIGLILLGVGAALVGLFGLIFGVRT